MNKLSDTYVDVRRHVTLDSRVRVDEPRASDITSGLEDLVLDDVLQLWIPMLKLLRHHQARKSCPDRDDTNFPRGEGELIVHWDDIVVVGRRQSILFMAQRDKRMAVGAIHSGGGLLWAGRNDDGWLIERAADGRHLRIRVRN